MHVCMHVCVCLGVCERVNERESAHMEVREQSEKKIGSHCLSFLSQGLKSDFQAYWQALLPAEPLCQALLVNSYQNGFAS